LTELLFLFVNMPAGTSTL